MKVKLAPQLISQSVADALKRSKYNLNRKYFSGSDRSVKFIEMFNNVLGIKSRIINCAKMEKAICHANLIIFMFFR